MINERESMVEEFKRIEEEFKVVIYVMDDNYPVDFAYLGHLVMCDLPLICIGRKANKPRRVIAMGDRFVEFDVLAMDWSHVALVRTAAEQLSSMEESAS